MGTLKRSYMYIKVGLTHLFQLLFLNLLTYLLAQYVNSWMTDELYYNRTNPLVLYVDPSLGLVYHPVVVFIQRQHTLGVCLTPVTGTYQYLKKK